MQLTTNAPHTIWTFLYELIVNSATDDMGDSIAILLTTNIDADSTNKAKNLCDLPDELLLQILSAVPLKDRVCIRSVSKKWHSIILDLGYHLEPDFISWPDTPYYPCGVQIRPNPIIDNLTNLQQIRQGFYRWGRMNERDVISLQKRRSEFITSPPISMVRLVWSDNLTVVLMTLRTATPAWKRTEGIRIEDLLDLFEKLSTSTSDPSAYWLGISFASAREADYRDHMVTQKAVGGAGIELRKFKWP